MKNLENPQTPIYSKPKGTTNILPQKKNVKCSKFGVKSMKNLENPQTSIETKGTRNLQPHKRVIKFVKFGN